MKLLFNYVKQYKLFVLLALLLASVNQVFSLLDSTIIQKIVDNYGSKAADYKNHRADFIYGILGLVGLALLYAMISRIAKNFQDYYVNVVTQRVGADIYKDGLKQSLALDFHVYEDQRSGETLGKLQKTRTDSERLISAFVSIIFQSIVGIIFVMVYAISVYWVIAPIYFATIPIVGGISFFLSKKIKVIQKKIVGETTALAGSTTESLRNIELVKSLGLANQEIERLNTTTSKILKLELNKVKYVRSLSFIQGTVINLLRNVMVVILMYSILQDRITLGQYFTLFFFSFFIFNPLQELGTIIQLYRETEVSLANFEALLKMPTEPVAANPMPINNLNKLVFRNVSFQHKTAKKPALKHIDFETEMGKTIAFVGPSGSGKTTLVKLLVGLYEPIEGTVLYNNVPHNQIDKNELRQRLGFVTQEAQLFSGSIKENLLFVKPDATDAQIWDALNKSACQNLLSRAENGIDSLIGEGGIKISGGEKQRLSIARALIRNPQLLVFDEATSALDSLTEEEISQTVRALSQSQSHLTILIAHRLSTIMHANTIYVLEKGSIIEQGTHDELLALKGLYYAMWRQQVGENTSLEMSS
jgi:ATP-binding cassette, subfamily B, bacterial